MKQTQTQSSLKYEAINNPDWVTRALLEEMLHAVTIPKLSSEKGSEQYKSLEKDYEKAKVLRETYKETPQYQALSNSQKERMDFIVNYHLDSFEEFVVGVSQPYFRAFLRLGVSEQGSLLEQVLEKVRKILNKILKGVAPSLYTDTTTDLFNFLLTKPEYAPVIEQTIAEEGVVPKIPKKERKEMKKRDVTLKPKFFSAPEEISIQVIQSLDAEIGDLLFKEGLFGDFVEGNLYANDVWDSYFNHLIEQDEAGVDKERQKWINYFVDNEQYLLEQWGQKSTLYTFTEGKLSIEEEELEEEEDVENPETQQGEDVGYNRVDSEQKYSRLQLADKYAKIFVKLTPKGYKDGALELVDFTNYWNKLQSALKNTLSIDEQKEILREKGFTKIVDRLDSLPSNVVSQIIVSSFQSSMGTAEVPVYNSYYTAIEDSNGNIKGYDYSFFESESLDVQNLETDVNSKFREFAEPYLIDRGFPTYDNNKLVEFLSKGSLIENYRKIGFPIPELDNYDQLIKETDPYQLQSVSY
ncbi:MAG: hypothetical protein IPK55_10835 [Streptococcus sp.]|nr:hypothetical protein [Streptococcus sp.]